MVVSEAGVLQLLHQLVLLPLPLGELGEDLAHGGDGESVGHRPERQSGVLDLVVTRKAGLGGDQWPVASGQELILIEGKLESMHVSKPGAF